MEYPIQQLDADTLDYGAEFYIPSAKCTNESAPLYVYGAVYHNPNLTDDEEHA